MAVVLKVMARAVDLAAVVRDQKRQVRLLMLRMVRMVELVALGQTMAVLAAAARDSQAPIQFRRAVLGEMVLLLAFLERRNATRQAAVVEQMLLLKERRAEAVSEAQEERQRLMAAMARPTQVRAVAVAA